MKNVILFLGILMFTKNQINPKMQSFTDEIAFQGSSEGNNEFL
jgi:hypothetical protein